ncbi:hypothetical protein [Sphingomonas sp. RIT328]|uniref:hypothetical protein n=1 Tax=Sphingomonas sp. RIT328 TaxID=1470591 RepID=UPI0012685128|nr:hypothetical protein [Sphingomonas sp. RIT328]
MHEDVPPDEPRPAEPPRSSVRALRANGRKVRLRGSFDGFCGIYAVINGLAQAGWSDGLESEHEARRVFISCCSALPKRSWPSTAWNRIGKNDLRKMVFKVAGELPGFPDVFEPFANRKFRYHARFWEKLIAHLGQEDIACAIVWSQYPTEQWLVLQHDPRGLRIIDSDPEQPLSTYVLDPSSISSGATIPETSLWYFDRRSVILFPKV